MKTQSRRRDADDFAVERHRKAGVDTWGGDRLQVEMDRARCIESTISFRYSRALRFCESCQKQKPRTGEARKGWKCDDCMGAA